MNIISFKNSIFCASFLGAILSVGCDDLYRTLPSNELHMAASMNDLERIDRALRNGYSIDTTDEVGNTALHIAAAYGKVDAIKRLTERGANVNLRDRTGRTPLHIATPQNEGMIFYRKYLKSINVLIDAGAYIDAQDNYGDTPLHRAAYWDCLENIRALKRRGANPRILNNRGQTPADQILSRIDDAHVNINRLRSEGRLQQAESYESDIQRYRRIIAVLAE